MKIDLWKQINAELNFEDFGRVLDTVFSGEFCLWKHCGIMFMELIKRLFVVADTFFIICMVSGPSIVIEGDREYVSFQEGLDRDALLHQGGEVLEEQVAGDKVVLVLNNVRNHHVHSLHLIGLESRINRGEVISAFSSLLLDFVLVDDWKLCREVLLMVVL